MREYNYVYDNMKNISYGRNSPKFQATNQLTRTTFVDQNL